MLEKESSYEINYDDVDNKEYLFIRLNTIIIILNLSRKIFY